MSDSLTKWLTSDKEDWFHYTVTPLVKPALCFTSLHQI